MLLSELFDGAPEIEIEQLVSDSRIPSRKGVFFCTNGLVHDGHQFIDQAIDNGSIVIIYQEPLKHIREGIVYIQVENTHDALVDAVNRFYDYPSRKLEMIGVTGTNGKSTIASCIRNVLNHFRKTGYIGTIAIEYGNVKLPPMLTTPDVIPLQKTLFDMVNADTKAVVLETSSHGLAMDRVKSIEFNQAIFTNLTHDHLDYHGTMENYYQAKKKLFTQIREGGVAIINVDDSYGDRLVGEVDCKVMTYAIHHPATYQAKNITLTKDKTTYTLIYDKQEYEVETNLVATFNVYNSLAIIASLHNLGLEFEEFLPYLKSMEPVEGRLEFIEEGQDFNVLVDFSHTPDGLKQIYEFARAITPKENRLISVFGSAGKRDKLKRPIFGQISDEYCDLIILTEDDNRNEKVRDICEEIEQGISKTNTLIIETRYDAIRQAIELANKNDTITILGKGNEPYMYRDFGTEPYLGDNNVAIQVIHQTIMEGEDDETE